MRAAWDIGPMASAAAGRIRCFSASQKASGRPASKLSTVMTPVLQGGGGTLSLRRPIVGKTFQTKPKMSMKITAQAKPGVTMPRYEIMRTRLSSQVSAYIADRTPSVMPSVAIITPATATSSSVAGKNSLMSCKTGRRVSRESPKSPWTASHSHNTYCSAIGRSRCICLLSLSTTSTGALGPRAIRAGSPGMIRAMMKIRIDRPKRTKMDRANLRKMKGPSLIKSSFLKNRIKRGEDEGGVLHPHPSRPDF